MNDLSETADQIETFAARAVQDAEGLAAAFEAAGERIAGSLEQAARRGELSFNQLAESIAQDLARLAINELLIGPLEGLIGGGGSPTINLNVSGTADAASFQRSAGQISADLTKAVLRGRKFI